MRRYTYIDSYQAELRPYTIIAAISGGFTLGGLGLNSEVFWVHGKNPADAVKTLKAKSKSEIDEVIAIFPGLHSPEENP